MNRRSVILPILIVLELFLSLPSLAAASGRWKAAPVNPDYLKYIEKERKALHAESASSDIVGAHPRVKFGYVPPTVDTSRFFKMDKYSSGLAASGAYPVSFDLRESNKLSPVKDQGNFGTCWAFATFGSIESYLRPLKAYDFSEYQLAYAAYSGPNSFSRDPLPETSHPILDQGGNCCKSIAVLSRWEGPYFESDCPYDSSGASPDMGADSRVRGHLQNSFLLSKSDAGEIKDALMDRGAVAASMIFDWGSYCSSNDAYYYNPNNPVSGGGHMVDIIGWDDDFPKANFTTHTHSGGAPITGSTPPGNGAWLVQDSFKNIRGDGGYFWISYYDGMICNFWSFEMEPASNYRNIYQYDPLGWIQEYGVDSGDTGWFANVFTSGETELLKAVSFYTAGENSSCEIRVYDKVGGNLVYGPQKETIPLAGYHTVKLDREILFERGKKLAVTVKLTIPGCECPVPVECACLGTSDNASADAGQSYLSADGTNWTDTTYWNTTMNVCLKAFAGPISLGFSGLQDMTCMDLTGTPEADMAIDEAREVVDSADPSSVGVAARSFRIIDMVDYRTISGPLESGRAGVTLNSPAILSPGHEDVVLLLAWNYETERFDLLSACTEGDGFASSGMLPVTVTDGGVYESPMIRNGSIDGLTTMEVLAEPLPDFASSGGGCAVGPAAPSLLLLLLPLIVLGRK